MALSGRNLSYPLAVASGGLLTLMILFNGQWAANGTALFASWMAHGTGTMAALVFLLVLRRPTSVRAPAGTPLWAYLGGLSGAVTVMLSSATVNSALALSGTLALGLVGQAGFSLLADRFGLFGLAQRRIGWAELASFALILGGSLMIIFAGGA